MSKKYLVLYKDGIDEWTDEYDTLKEVIAGMKRYSSITGIVYKRLPVTDKRKSNVDPLGVFVVKLEEK